MFKRIFIVIIMSFTVLALFNTPLVAADNIDKVLNSTVWRKTLTLTEEQDFQNPILQGYLNVLFNENDLRAMKLDGWIKRLADEYPDKTLRFLHAKLIYIIFKAAPQTTDSELIYVTGAIKDTYAQAATNATEYEMEKMMLRQFPLYRIWEQVKKDGVMEDLLTFEIEKLISST